MAILLLLLTTSCATYHRERLPTLAGHTISLPDEKKVSVSFDISYLLLSPRKSSQEIDDADAKDIFQGIVLQAARESGLFRKISFDRTQSYATDFCIRICMRETATDSFAKEALNALSLFLVPITYVNKYDLTARVIDRNGIVIAEHNIQSSARTWLGLLILPLAREPTQNTLYRVQDNMVCNLFKQMYENTNLPFSRTEPLQNSRSVTSEL